MLFRQQPFLHPPDSLNCAVAAAPAQFYAPNSAIRDEERHEIQRHQTQEHRHEKKERDPMAAARLLGGAQCDLWL